jgi:ABC-type amino acid transport system permease subunit
MKRNKIRISIAIIAAILTIALSTVLYSHNLNWPHNNASAYIIIISNTCLIIMLMIVNEVEKSKKSS